MSKVMARILISVLMVTVGASAAAKILSPHSSAYWTTAWMYYTAVAWEIVALMMLMTRARFWGCVAVVCLCSAGLAVGLLVDPSRPCGCFGSVWQASRRQELLAACTVGALASMAAAAVAEVGKGGHLV